MQMLTMCHPDTTTRRRVAAVTKAHKRIKVRHRSRSSRTKNMKRSCFYCHELLYSTKQTFSTTEPMHVAEEVGPEDAADGVNQLMEVADEVGVSAPRRRRSEEAWDRNVRRRKRVSGDAYTSSRGKHVQARQVLARTCKFNCPNGCWAWSEEERQECFTAYYAIGNEDQQRQFLLAMMAKKKVSAERIRHRINYTLPKGGEKVQVCRNFFLETLNVGEKYVRNIRQALITTHVAPVDNRGRHGNQHTKSKYTEAQVEDTRSFIMELPAVPSHYTRQHTTKKYLPAEFKNIRKLAVYNLTFYEVGSQRGLCNVWDESNGKRDSNEVASLVVAYVPRIDEEGSTDDVSLYCDNCTGQNKNRAVVNAVFKTLQTCKTVEKISMNYLLKGHTYMPCDSMHAVIENSLKKQMVYAPSQWTTIIRIARHTPFPYEVKTLTWRDWRNWAPLGQRTLKTLKLKQVSRIEMERGDQLITVEQNFDPDTRQRVRVSSCRGPGRGLMPQTPPQAYSGPIQISAEKKRDLLKLVQNGTIPDDFKDEYERIPAAPTVPDVLVESDIDDPDTEDEAKSPVSLKIPLWEFAKVSCWKSPLTAETPFSSCSPSLQFQHSLCIYRLSLRNMSLPLCLLLCVLGLSWTGANGSCPGPYKSVSYTLRSQNVEACFFVSTDYVRWADGGDFWGRRNNGSLAEFPSNRKLQAFQNFLSTIPDTTKDELWDAEHAWIGGAVLNGSVWRWHSSGKELESSISEELPIGDFYGLTINVHSKELVPFRLQSLSPGHQTIHSYVCETDPRETEQTGSSVPQTVARDSSECQAELKRTQEELEGFKVQLLVADCPCSNRSIQEAEAGVKEERISGLERELGEERRLNGAKILALESELREERRLRATKEDIILKQQEFLVAKEERTAALESELREERRLRATKEEIISKQQEFLVVKEERTAALESDLREEKRLNGAKISALEEKRSLLEGELETHSRHCSPGSKYFPQEGVMTVSKLELQNLEQPGASPQPPSLTIGAWTMDLFMRNDTGLFFVVTYSGRVDQAYALTFQVRVNAEKVWTPYSYTYTSEYFDRRRRTSAVCLLAKGDVPKLLSKYEDEESFRLEVRLLEAVATGVKGNAEKNEITIKERFANVSAMELWDGVYSEPHFLRGFRLRLLARRRTDSLALHLSCIGNLLEGDYSVNVTFTLTLERDGGKGGPEANSATYTCDPQKSSWGWGSFVKWEELVAPGSGWIGEDGSVSVSSTVKINE
ncbi:unnamed protein product [Cyprideis torosa]|uniref:Uncharacterized protein n=1 Tax=Cyprideis torosa TaxID=163714 RepID=A0A7R8WJX2_9CRUS|nr:unnamed protein product [Cyprideis torosa]CAG0900691.1 unnamed protein product [Cyprideis torosa]